MANLRGFGRQIFPPPYQQLYPNELAFRPPPIYGPLYQPIAPPLAVFDEPPRQTETSPEATLSTPL